MDLPVYPFRCHRCRGHHHHECSAAIDALLDDTGEPVTGGSLVVVPHRYPSRREVGGKFLHVGTVDVAIGDEHIPRHGRHITVRQYVGDSPSTRPTDARPLDVWLRRALPWLAVLMS